MVAVIGPKFFATLYDRKRIMLMNLVLLLRELKSFEKGQNIIDN